MDWNLKPCTSWDFPGFEQEIVLIDALDKSTSAGDHATGSDFSVDLKLGKMVTNSSNETFGKFKQPGALKMENLQPSGSTKRARAATNGTQVVSCLVDGCASDLSNCREYHRRHKVCEVHSKTSQVTIGGRLQRFCQQCSRFHSLEEFDEGKRSCRKRLAGHNRRRRKLQPDPLLRPVNVLRNYQGAQLFPLSSPHVYPSTAVLNPTWSAVSEADAGQYNNLHQRMNFPEKQTPFCGSSLNIYKGEKQFPFFQGNNPILNNQKSHNTSVCQPLLNSITRSPSVEECSQRQNRLCERLSTQVQDMDCALSLLSAKQTHTTPEIQIKQQQPQPDSIPFMHSLNQNVDDRAFEPVDSLLVSNSRNSDDVHRSSAMFVVGSSFSGTKADQTLPFTWE